MTKKYSEETPADIYQKYITDLDIGEAITIAGKIGEEPIVNDIITPSSLSAKNILHGMLADTGYNLIIDKFESYIVADEWLEDQHAKTTGETFVYKPRDIHRRDQVIEYYVDGFDSGPLEQSVGATTSTISKNLGKEKMSMATEPTKRETDKTINGQPTTNYIYQNGKKLSGISDPAELTKALNEAQTCRIWVPGWNGQRLGKKIGLELPRTSSMPQESNSEIYSGEWIVSAQRDKMINSYFIQELFLRRIGQ
jgi:hypothetical protein